jgi:hypothetical protein
VGGVFSRIPRNGWTALGVAVVLAVAVGAVVVGTVHDPTHGAGPAARCNRLADRYGLVPCPPAPLPVEAVPVRNLDPDLPDAQAQRIARAYLRSRWLYYAAISANSEKFFHAPVIDLPADSPLMFDAEVQHIRDARAAKGRLVVRSKAKLRGLLVVPLPDDLRDDLGTATKPIADAIVIDAAGPEVQAVEVAGQPDRTVTELGPGDSVQLLVGGVLTTAPDLDETFAELGQWGCLDPDTHGACRLPPA